MYKNFRLSISLVRISEKTPVNFDIHAIYGLACQDLLINKPTGWNTQVSEDIAPKDMPSILAY